MDKKIIFLIYCMERYRYFKKLSGKEVADLFEKYKVNDYIIRYFESLYVLGGTGHWWVYCGARSLKSGKVISNFKASFKASKDEALNEALNANEKLLLSLFAKNPYLTQKCIMGIMRLSRVTVQSSIKILTGIGCLQRQGSRKS